MQTWAILSLAAGVRGPLRGWGIHAARLRFARRRSIIQALAPPRMGGKFLRGDTKDRAR